jgi:anti-sigma regulatory factor (Ser/Thr protein kinase)/ActR/RegA family two-component response regulator
MAQLLVIGRSPEIAAALTAFSALKGHTIHHAAGVADALRVLRAHPVQVVITDPETHVTEDIAIADELSGTRPGLRVIVLAPAASSDEVIAAIRAHVFACFTAPFDLPSIVDMIHAALAAEEWRDGIEVVSGLPHWLTLRVSCHLMTAERLVSFIAELQAAQPDDQRDLLIAAFRELLLNAMEHGAGFDPNKVIEVTAARTERAIVYHFRDPGIGFDAEDLGHAAGSASPEDVLAAALKRAEMGLRPGGFGMLIARQVADELVYNERRNEVLLIKHLT